MTTHKTHVVRIIESAAAPLTPEQRKFNTLVKKIETVRAELLAWREQRVVFGTVHRECVAPVLAELLGLHIDVVQKLDAMLTGAASAPKPPGKGWAKGDKAVMRRFVCELAGDLLEGASLDDAQAELLEALYNRHAQTDFASEQRESAEMMKALFEKMGGVDLGDRVFDTEEDVVRAMREKMVAQMDAQRADNEARTAGRKPTAAQRRRAQEDQDASQSLREVYRKLASALHPDRADDAADGARRTALMQRVNQAYERQDLLALFSLQLEVEQVNVEQLAQSSAQKARHYNRLLDEQLKALQAELHAERAHFYIDFNLDPNDNVRPNQLGLLLEREMRRMRSAVMQSTQDLKLLSDAATAKRWIAKMKQRQALNYDDDLSEFLG